MQKKSTYVETFFISKEELLRVLIEKLNLPDNADYSLSDMINPTTNEFNGVRINRSTEHLEDGFELCS